MWCETEARAYQFIYAVRLRRDQRRGILCRCCGGLDALGNIFCVGFYVIARKAKAERHVHAMRRGVVKDVVMYFLPRYR
jgi:hypothetical protein